MIHIRTQLELSKHLGVTPEYLLKIKTGERNLSKKRQILLKEFYRNKILDLQKTIDD